MPFCSKRSDIIMLNLKILKLTGTLLTIALCITPFSCRDDSTKPENGNDKEEHEYTPDDDFVTTWKRITQEHQTAPLFTYHPIVIMITTMM